MLERGEKLYTVREVMQLLGLSRTRVHELLKSRRVRVTKAANVVLVPESEVKRLLQEERRPGRPPSRMVAGR